MQDILAATILLTVFFGGLVKGFNGFGFAVVGTTILATLLKPVEAVTIMIIPLIAAEIDLISDLRLEEIKTCIKNFYPFMISGIFGTVAGIMIIDYIPVKFLELGLGVVSIGFVANREVEISGFEKLKKKCFRKGTGFQTLVGILGGLFFGASNIAIQVVEYLETLDIDHRTFEGLLAMVMIGFSLIRLPLSIHLGYFNGVSGLLSISLLAAIPGLIGVSIGDRLSNSVNDALIEKITLGLILGIGLKLFATGIGII